MIRRSNPSIIKLLSKALNPLCSTGTISRLPLHSDSTNFALLNWVNHVKILMRMSNQRHWEKKREKTLTDSWTGCKTLCWKTELTVVLLCIVPPPSTSHHEHTNSALSPRSPIQQCTVFLSGQNSAHASSYRSFVRTTPACAHLSTNSLTSLSCDLISTPQLNHCFCFEVWSFTLKNLQLSPTA